MKTIDLTIRQIIEICDKNNKHCSKCPLFTSMLDCHRFNTEYKDIVLGYNREKLMEEEVEVKIMSKELNYEKALEHICKTCDNNSCPYIHYGKSRCVWYGIIKKAIEKAKRYDELVKEEE